MKKGVTPKKKTGFSEYDCKYTKQAYELCLLGFTDQQLADVFQMSVRTLHRWKGSRPKLKLAILRGVFLSIRAREGLF